MDRGLYSCWWPPQVRCHQDSIFMRPKMLPQPVLLRTGIQLGVPPSRPIPSLAGMTPGGRGCFKWGSQCSVPCVHSETQHTFSSTCYMRCTVLITLTWFIKHVLQSLKNKTKQKEQKRNRLEGNVRILIVLIFGGISDFNFFIPFYSIAVIHKLMSFNKLM